MEAENEETNRPEIETPHIDSASSKYTDPSYRNFTDTATDPADVNAADPASANVSKTDLFKVSSQYSAINPNDTPLARVMPISGVFKNSLLTQTGVPEKYRLTLSWSNISATPKSKGRKKKEPTKILEDVNGVVLPGKLMGLMGASGAGKTTLMNVLTFRKMGGLNIKGSVRVNGHKVNRKIMSDISAYVPQKDIFFGCLTVREHLCFHSALRLKKLPRKAREINVNRLIFEMGLTSCQNTHIGIPGTLKGISGGEMRRLSFATEVIDRSILIFCDEPTSGLDSYLARSLVERLKNYASHGRTIICTIHQPSSEIFELFDDICLMANGKCVFIGKSSDCYDIFVAAGFPCPTNYNPADHYTLTLSMVPGFQEHCLRRIDKIARAFAASGKEDEVKNIIRTLESHPQSDKFMEKAQEMECILVSLGHGFTQFRLIFDRQLKNAIRNPASFFVRFIGLVIVSFCIGILYHGIDFDKQSSRNNTVGLIFILAFLPLHSTVILLTIVIPNDSEAIQRDSASNLYPIPIYYFAIAVFFTIEVLLTIIVIVNVIFWLTFYAAPVSLLALYRTVTAAIVMEALVAIAIGLFVSSMCDSFEASTTIVNPLLSIFSLFSGTFISRVQIPDGLLFIIYLNPCFYAVELMMCAVYDGMPCPCHTGPSKDDNATFLKTENEFIKTDAKDEKRLISAVLNFCNPPENTCTNTRSGQDNLDFYGFENQNFRDYICLFGLCLGFHILGFLILTLRMWQKTR